MQSTLAEIGAMSDATLAHHYDNPTIPLTFTTVAGFPIVNEKERQIKIQVRRDAIDVYRRHRTALIADLEKNGIAPLTVIPTKFWHKLCRESRLYRFKPDLNGEVKVEDRDWKIFSRVALVLSFPLWTLPAAALLYGFFTSPSNSGRIVSELTREEKEDYYNV